MCII